MQQIVILTSSIKYHGLSLFYDLQVKTFKSSYYSSYFRVEMLERKHDISPRAFDHFAVHLRG